MRNMLLVWKHSMLGVMRLKLKSFKHEGLLHSVVVVVCFVFFKDVRAERFC